MNMTIAARMIAISDEAEPELLADLHRALLLPHDERVERLDVLVLDVDHLLQLLDVDFLDVLPRATASRPA